MFISISLSDSNKSNLLLVQVVKPSVDVNASASSRGAEVATISAGPQMRNIRREATRFVPTAVKIQRPLVHPPPAASANAASIGPRVPIASAHRTTSTISVKQQRTKTADEACDDFLRELQGIL